MSSFIPKPSKKESVTIRVELEKLAKIDKLAHSYEMSRNEFINQCIDFAIKRMTKTENADEKN